MYTGSGSLGWVRGGEETSPPQTKPREPDLAIRDQHHDSIDVRVDHDSHIVWNDEQHFI